MKDASVLGEGSFGCVVKPALPCKGKQQTLTPSKGPQVSKIFSEKKYFDREVKTSKKAAKVDPSGQKLLLPSKICKTTKKVVENYPVISSQCESISDVMNSKHSPRVFYQLLMPYGGTRLDHYVRDNPTTRKQMLAMMRYAMDGLVLLRKKKMCHQDIKTGNMLRKPSGEAILIDYSLMVPFKEVYNENNHRRWRYVYVPHPPEYYLTYMLHQDKCPFDVASCNLEDRIKENLESFGKRYISYVKFHADLKEELTDLVSWMTSIPKTRLLKTMSPYAAKMDIYSMGMVMIDLDRYLQAEKTWDRRNKAKYAELLHGMTHPDPRKRWDLKEIIQRFEILLG